MNRITGLFLGVAIAGHTGVASADMSKTSLGTTHSAFIQEYDNTLAPLQFVKFCMNHSTECEQDHDHSALPNPEAARQILSEINTAVNDSIVAQPKSIDPWTARWEVAPPSGDCNDYAVTKRHDLIAKGWPSSALRLAVVLTEQGVGHLVLVARIDDGDVVLDNLSKHIRGWSATGYKWVSMQSADNPRFWVAIDKEGERRRMGRLAAASTPAPPPGNF